MRLPALITSLLLVALPAAADHAFTIDVYPKYTVARPGGSVDVRLTVWVPQDPQNRALCLGYDGEQFRSSCMEWAGERAALRQQTTFPGLPQGSYVAFAVVGRADGSQRQVTTEFEVR